MDIAEIYFYDKDLGFTYMPYDWIKYLRARK